VFIENVVGKFLKRVKVVEDNTATLQSNVRNLETELQ
jgi:hypothetical protein